MTVPTTAELRELHCARVAADKAAWHAQRRELEANYANASAAREEIMACTRVATPTDYGRWLAAYFAAGGQPTHFYDYRMPTTFRVAVTPLGLVPLFGAMSLEIIVPNGVTVIGSPGHTTVYRMDDPLSVRFVPVYSDGEVIP